MPFDEPRRRILQHALEELVCEKSMGDDIEARAVALAMLAQQDTGYLVDANAALDHAITEGLQSNWILFYMAEAWFAAGNLPGALSCASSVQSNYFDDEDLHWRSVRMDEIRAATLLKLRRFSEGVEVAMNVCAELARRGDIDDLAPPVQLTQAALSLVVASPSAEAIQAGCAVLHAISHSIDLKSWFPPELVDEIETRLLACN
ncbi:MAG: hypothetical protein M3Y48_08250 [Actinomycetota bacterium]|nr:hypothetical protein [Actinomycetota bacterium]